MAAAVKISSSLEVIVQDYIRLMKTEEKKSLSEHEHKLLKNFADGMNTAKIREGY